MVTINLVDERLTVDAAEEFAQNWIPVSGTEKLTHQWLIRYLPLTEVLATLRQPVCILCLDNGNL